MSFNLQAGGLYRLNRRSQGNILVISAICWSQLGLREPTRPRLCERSEAIFRENRGVPRYLQQIHKIILIKDVK